MYFRCEALRSEYQKKNIIHHFSNSINQQYIHLLVLYKVSQILFNSWVCFSLFFDFCFYSLFVVTLKFNCILFNICLLCLGYCSLPLHYYNPFILIRFDPIYSWLPAHTFSYRKVFRKSVQRFDQQIFCRKHH